MLYGGGARVDAQRVARAVAISLADLLLIGLPYIGGLTYISVASRGAHGVRRENAAKNIGARTGAFNPLQRSFLPREYQPPKHTAGGWSDVRS